LPYDTHQKVQNMIHWKYEHRVNAMNGFKFWQIQHITVFYRLSEKITRKIENTDFSWAK